MTKLVIMSTLAAVLSVAIATNATAFPHRGSAFAHGRVAAGVVGGAGQFDRGAGDDVWGHWGSYYGPMVGVP